MNEVRLSMVPVLTGLRSEILVSKASFELLMLPGTVKFACRFSEDSELQPNLCEQTTTHSGNTSLNLSQPKAASCSNLLWIRNSPAIANLVVSGTGLYFLQAASCSLAVNITFRAEAGGGSCTVLVFLCKALERQRTVLGQASARF